MPDKDYVNLSIPKNLIEEVDKIVTKKKHGYMSRAEFIKEAIRNLLRQTKEK